MTPIQESQGTQTPALGHENAAQLLEFSSQMLIIQQRNDLSTQAQANLDNPFGLMKLPPVKTGHPDDSQSTFSQTPLPTEANEDLGTFLKWAYTVVPPYSPVFLAELQRAQETLLKVSASPQGLSNASKAMTTLSYISELVEEEERRLRRLHEEFIEWKSYFHQKYTQEEAAQWLREYISRQLQAG